MATDENNDMGISVWYLIKKHLFEFKGLSPEKVLEAIIKEAENPNSEFEWRHACELCEKVIAPVLLGEESESTNELLAQIVANSESTD